MADEDDDLEQIARDTENDLMQGAFEKEPKPEPAEPEAKERARDPETGRYTKAQPAEASEGAADVVAEEQKVSPDHHERKPEEEEILPSWRAREINEERRQAQAELERMRVEHARLQAWAAQQQRAAQPAQEPAPPDPVLDPAAYSKWVQDGLRREFMAQQTHDRLNMNLELAELRYGERFQKAFEALVIEGQRGNNQLVRQLVADPNRAGANIMRWYSQAEMEREVGPDFSAYKQKTREQLREELLNDPEHLAAAEQRLRDRAMGVNSGQPSKPNTVVRMPPSLSKATGSADAPATATDGSEDALFAYAIQPKRRG